MSLTVDLPTGRTAFAESVTAFVRAVDAVDEWDLLGASRCHGWTRLDVVVHVLAGWQEMLGGMVVAGRRRPDGRRRVLLDAPSRSLEAGDPLLTLMAQRRRTAAYSRPSAACRAAARRGRAVLRGAASLADRHVAWQGQVFTPGDFLAIWALAAIGDELPDDVRVVVVKGAGAAFSAGLDRSDARPGTARRGLGGALMRRSDEEVSAAIDGFQRGFTLLRDPRFVSIAAVHGYAIGAGFQLALSCDLRVVADDAQFCMKESALGLVPDLTGTKPLVESVGYARALEICATARMVGASEAVDIGLALTAVPVEELDATVADLVAP